MKREMFRKLMAVSLATAMTVGMTACGGETQTSSEQPSSSESKPSESSSEVASSSSEEEVGLLPIIKDADGNPIDLGGM